MKRREFLRVAGALPAAMAGAAAHAAPRRTPSQSEGPYYPVTPIAVHDGAADLVRDAAALKGEVLHLAGRVLDEAGQALPGIKVEIWQCDGAGIYAHPSHRNHAAFDPSFAGAGATVTDADGGYTFRTMLPVPYTGRPPHIHVKLWRGADEALTSQLYLHGQTGREWFGNKREYLQIAPAADADGRLAAQFVFVV